MDERIASKQRTIEADLRRMVDSRSCLEKREFCRKYLKPAVFRSFGIRRDTSYYSGKYVTKQTDMLMDEMYNALKHLLSTAEKVNENFARHFYTRRRPRYKKPPR